jgi:enoyl-CoA hydratase/carnithine racemase
MTETDSVLVEHDGPVTIVSINRPHCRNAVDGATARKLYDAFLAFDADETASVALRMGLANRLVPKGEARAQAIAFTHDIAGFPQTCLRADRLSALRQWDFEEEEAIANEMRGGLKVMASGETPSGATRFASGVGRHGASGGGVGNG